MKHHPQTFWHSEHSTFHSPCQRLDVWHRPNTARSHQRRSWHKYESDDEKVELSRHGVTESLTGRLPVSACLDVIKISYWSTPEEISYLSKNLSDVGSRPASWIDVNPKRWASRTATLKRLNRSPSVSLGCLSNSCALSKRTPSDVVRTLKEVWWGFYLLGDLFHSWRLYPHLRILGRACWSRGSLMRPTEHDGLCFEGRLVVLEQRRLHLDQPG